MASTLTVGLSADLVQEVEQKYAQWGFRSSADMIYEATVNYIKRRLNWERIFSQGKQFAANKAFTEDDVMAEIKANRRGK